MHSIKPIYSLLVFMLFGLIACQPNPETTTASIEEEEGEEKKLSPLEALAPVNALLDSIAEAPQKLTAPADKPSLVTGAQGTIVHVDPSSLECVDGSPLGEEIAVELIEMTDLASLLLHDAPTLSDGRLLVSGGAYKINMRSNGKALRIKDGKSIAVEFPRFTEADMQFFRGEKDSLGQINWLPTEESFVPKEITEPEKPERKPQEVVIRLKVYDEQAQREVEQKPERKEGMSDSTYQQLLKEYEQRMAEIEYQRKTYQAVNLTDFGYINCDRFYNVPGEKVSLELALSDTTFPSAKFYAAFSEINSLMGANYWDGMKTLPSFRNVPQGQQLRVIGLAVKDQQSYYFEQALTTSADGRIKVDFTPTSQEAIAQRMKDLGR